jgi:hypothetical protein
VGPFGLGFGFEFLLKLQGHLSLSILSVIWQAANLDFFT